MLDFGLSILKKAKGRASGFASRYFSKSVILASCIFVVGAICRLLCLLYCHFPFFLIIGFPLLVFRLLCIGNLLFNRRKTAIFDDFRLFWAFFGHLFLTEYKRLIFSGTIIHPNIFRLRLFRALSDAWFAQKEFLIELNSPISAVHFSFGSLFNIWISFDFPHIPTLSFLVDVIYNGENRLSISSFTFEKFGANIGEHLKNSSNFEQRERKYANTWGDGGRERGQKSPQKHSYCVPSVFITIYFHSALTFMSL